MALAGTVGDRLAGLGACLVLATFRWWLGLLFLVGWLVLRPPLRRLLAERALLTRRATPALRHSWYYLGCAWRPQFAKEMRVFGLGDWILGRYRERWTDGMAPSWAAMSCGSAGVLVFGALVAVMYGAGAGALGLAAYRQQIGLGDAGRHAADDGDDHAGRRGDGGRRAAGADAGRGAGPGQHHEPAGTRPRQARARDQDRPPRAGQIQDRARGKLGDGPPGRSGSGW